MKIALLLPESADFGWRWRAAQYASHLMSLDDKSGSKIEVAIGLPRCDEEQWRLLEAELLTAAPGVIVRHLGWERVPTDVAQRMYPQCKAELCGIGTVTLPRDWGWNFVDCDAWIVFADPKLGAIYPVKPTAYYVKDLAVRYSPRSFAQSYDSEYWRVQDEAFRLWRQSPVVFANDPATIDDIVGYAGVRRMRTRLTSISLPLKSDGGSLVAARNIVWIAEPYIAHDPVAALEGLRIYQTEGGEFSTIVAGAEAFGFDPREGQATLGMVPIRSRRSMLDAEFETCPSDAAMRRVLRRASFVWSSAIADGENEGLLRAASQGLPFVGLKYPQSVRLAESLKVKAFFYDRSEPDLIADALHQATQYCLSEKQAATAKPGPGADWSAVVQALEERLDG